MLKSTPPIEVTLNKSSSGTWKLSGAPRGRFEPWQRLWFVAAIMYLLMLAGTYHLIMPDQESIERRMVLAVIEEVHRYDGMAFAREAPQKIFESARSQGYAAWIAQVRSRYRIGPEDNPGFDKIDKGYRDALSDLPLKQTIGIMFCVVAWLVPMGFLYGMGLMVDWIKRGARGMQG